MNIKLNFILISDKLQQFHIRRGSPKLTININKFGFLFSLMQKLKEKDPHIPL